MTKPSYDILRAEFTELVAQVIDGAAKFDPAVAGQDPKKAQFRINRDLRFSKDKSPYKTHFSAAIAPAAGRIPARTTIFHIDHRGKLLVAGGCYMPPADVLAKIRASHRAASRQRFKRLLGVAEPLVHFGAFADEGKLARPPKGFAPDAPHIDYIKQKSFVVWTEKPVRTATARRWRRRSSPGSSCRSLIRWLREATAGDSCARDAAAPDAPSPDVPPPDPSAAPKRATLPQVARRGVLELLRRPQGPRHAAATPHRSIRCTS